MPLFSKVFYMKHLEIDTDKIISMIDNHFENSGTNTPIDVDNISSVSISKSILELENFIDLKKQLMNELNNFFHNVMNYESDFKITTSWFTKSQNSQSSNYHNHNNSMFSGILYLQTDENSGDISFEDFNNRRIESNIIPLSKVVPLA